MNRGDVLEFVFLRERHKQRTIILFIITQHRTPVARVVDAIHEIRPALNHSLVHEFLEGFILAAYADVVEEFVPEARVDEVACGVLRAADVEIDVLPVFRGLFREQRLVVVRIHIAQIVGRGTGKSGHRVQFEGEHRFVVDERIIDDLLFFHVPRPFFGVSEWWFARGRGLIGFHLGQQQRQTFLGQHIGHVVFVIDGERLAPVALSRENGVAQAIVHFHLAQTLLGDVFFRFLNGFLHGQAVQRKFSIRGVHHDAFLRIETLFRHVGTLDERNNRQVEMLGKGIVARIVGRNGHDGTRSVASQYVFGNPDGDFLARERVDGVGTGEDARHLVVHLSLALGALFHVGEVFIHGLLLLGRSELLHEFAFGCQNHESDTENRVGAGGEDGESLPRPLQLEGRIV